MDNPAEFADATRAPVDRVRAVLAASRRPQPVATLRQVTRLSEELIRRSLAALAYAHEVRETLIYTGRPGAPLRAYALASTTTSAGERGSGR